MTLSMEMAFLNIFFYQFFFSVSVRRTMIEFVYKYPVRLLNSLVFLRKIILLVDF